MYNEHNTFTNITTHKHISLTHTHTHACTHAPVVRCYAEAHQRTPGIRHSSFQSAATRCLATASRLLATNPPTLLVYIPSHPDCPGADFSRFDPK